MILYYPPSADVVLTASAKGGQQIIRRGRLKEYH